VLQDEGFVRNDPQCVAAFQQVLGQRAHGFADARVDRTAGKGDTGTVGWASIHTVACLLAWRSADRPA
jgi:hypothetical protein